MNLTVLPARWTGAILLLTAFVAIGGHALADDSGIFGHSGRSAGLTCSLSRCHGAGSGGSTVSFTLTPKNTDLPSIALGYVPGARYTVNVAVTGGPNVRNGFNWDAEAGVSFAADQTTRKNQQIARPAEMTHSLAGRLLSSWAFDWVAPADRRTIRFWLAGNSTNGNGNNSGDAPTPPITSQVTPVPVEVLARIGNVNDTLGDPVPVIFVNGSRGDDARVVTIETNGPPMEISIGTYPGAQPEIRYVLYALRRENRADDGATITGVGPTSFAFPVSGGTPVVVVNTLQHEPQLGTPRVPSTPLGPGAILTIPQVPSKVAGARITLQGLVLDSTSVSGGAVTNAVVVSFL